MKSDAEISSKEKLVFSIKTNDLYEITSDVYDKLLKDTISTKYNKANVERQNNINDDANTSMDSVILITD